MRKQAKQAATGFAWAIAVLVMMQAVFAIGASPARIKMDIDDYSSGEFSFRVLNNDKMDIEVEISVQGELAQHVMLQEHIFSMNPEEDIREVKGLVELPKNESFAGERKADIIVMARPAGQNSMINVVGAVIVKLSADVAPANATIEYPRLIDSRSTDGIPTPKGGEELINEGGFVVEKSHPRSSSPFLSYLLIIGMVAAIGAAFLMVHKNEKKYI